MTEIKWFSCFLVLLANSYLQTRYAQANYPQSRHWKNLLFFGGVLLGTLAGWALMPLSGWREFLLAACTFGLLSGYVFLNWFPLKMQTIYPKKDKGA